MGRDFGDALKALRQLKRCRRRGWNGKGQWIALKTSRLDNGVSCLPYIYISTVDGQRVPWVASQTDLLARDWEVMPDEA